MSGICFVLLAVIQYTASSSNNTMFKSDQAIFESKIHIAKLLVAPETVGKSLIIANGTNFPTIFFTAHDVDFKGHSCIYVLEESTAHRVLEGGTDSTAVYGSHKVYLGSKYGLYVYHSEDRSTKRFGKFSDEIIQLQAANGFDEIYILASNLRIYRIENEGTVKIRVNAVRCAHQFVLDNSNNIFYIDCHDNMPHLVRSDGSMVGMISSEIEVCLNCLLLRPAYNMGDCVFIIADGFLYTLYANASSKLNELYIHENPTAYSIDAALYIAVAFNGQIYKYDIMNSLSSSVFGQNEIWPNDLTRLFVNIIESTRRNIFHLKDIY